MKIGVGSFSAGLGLAGILGGVGMMACLVIAAYSPSLKGGFLMDDDLLLTENRLIRADDGLYRFWFSADPADYWPLTSTTLWLEWRLWGMNPTGYRITNLLLHIACSLLLWRVLWKLSIPGAYLGALLFAIHPVNVESVTWIAQRKNLLAMLFFLLSALWYLKADSQPQRLGRWHGLSLGAFVLGMLSKGSVAIFPVALLLMAWWRRGRILAVDVLRSAPFFAIAAALTAVNIWFQTHGSGQIIRDAGWAERIAAAGAVVWFYLFKALMPVGLMFIYPQWHVQVDQVRWWLPLASVTGVTLLLIWQRQSRLGGAMLFAWAFFCVALIPVMGLVDVGFMQYSLVADHYQHIALIAVVALAGTGWSLWRRSAFMPVRASAWFSAVVVVAAATLLSWRHSRLYADPMTLYAATVEKNPNCWVAHNNLGALLTRSAKAYAAIEHFRKALLLRPVYPEAHYNYAMALIQLNRFEEAIEHFQKALECRSDYPQAHNGLGVALARMGRLKDALVHLEQAVKLWPEFAQARNNLANTLAGLGRTAEAIEQYEQALRDGPDYAETHNNLGAVLRQVGQTGKAVEHFRQAIAIDSDYADAHYNLALTLLQTAESSDEAIGHLEHYLRLEPNDAQGRFRLATALWQMNKPAQAVEQAQRARASAWSSGQTSLAERIETWLKPRLQTGQRSTTEPH